MLLHSPFFSLSFYLSGLHSILSQALKRLILKELINSIAALGLLAFLGASKHVGEKGVSKKCGRIQLFLLGLEGWWTVFHAAIRLVPFLM